MSSNAWQVNSLPATVFVNYAYTIKITQQFGLLDVPLIAIFLHVVRETAHNYLATKMMDTPRNCAFEKKKATCWISLLLKADSLRCLFMLKPNTESRITNLAKTRVVEFISCANIQRCWFKHFTLQGTGCSKTNLSYIYIYVAEKSMYTQIKYL